jgi:hypothetical protein
MGQATQKQIEFAQNLISQLGYDADDYDFDRMSFGEVSTLIDELKAERGE